MSKTAVRNGIDNGNDSAATKDDILTQLAECCRKTSKTLELVSEKIVDNRKVIDDHELRIRKLEGAQSRTAAQSQPVAQPAAQPAAQSQPVAQPAAQQPVAQPASKSATQQSPQSVTDNNKATKPIVNPVPVAPIGAALSEGPTRMYKYWDYKHGVWAGPKRDLFAAMAAGNGVWEPVWVWTKDGKIDHFLTMEEIEKYCP